MIKQWRNKGKVSSKSALRDREGGKTAKMVDRMSAMVSLFTRFPNPPGSSKTRLIPTLGPLGASRCQTVMTEHILNTLLGIGDIAVEVRYATSSNSDDDVRAAMDFWLSPRQVNDHLDLDG